MAHKSLAVNRRVAYQWCGLYSTLLFQTDGEAVADRQDGRVKIIRRVDQAVELALAFGVLVGVVARDFAIPERVIGDEQPAAPHARHGFADRVGVLVLVHVVEDQIELALYRVEQLHRIAREHFDTRGHAGALEIAARFGGVSIAAVRVIDAALLAYRF